MRLTYATAKEFAIEVMSKKFSGSDYEWQVKHFENTEKCALLLANKNQKDDVPLHLKRWSLKRHSSFGCKKNPWFFCTENLKILLCSRSDHTINGVVFCQAS